MHFVKKKPKEKRLNFVKKLRKNKILRVPGAYNPLTAKLIEEIGYDAVYVSGAVMAKDRPSPSSPANVVAIQKTPGAAVCMMGDPGSNAKLKISTTRKAKKAIALRRSLVRHSVLRSF